MRSAHAKHPYEHPHGIGPCGPQRLTQRKSRQVGSIDAENRASGMRYQVSFAQPIRAQIEPSSASQWNSDTLISTPMRSCPVAATTCRRCGVGVRSIEAAPTPPDRRPIRGRADEPRGNRQRRGAEQRARAPIRPSPSRCEPTVSSRRFPAERVRRSARNTSPRTSQSSRSGW